jgi:hypothetical protein
MRRYLKELGLGRTARRALEALPLVGVGRDGGAPFRAGLLFFSARALENILTEHRRAFARVRVTASPRKGRTIVIAVRRRVGRMIVFAGPSGVGKSRLIEAIRQDGAGLGQRFGLCDAADWPAVGAARLGDLREPQLDRLIFHYDLLRYVHANHPVPERDGALDLFDCADSIEVYTLVCPLSLLRARVQECLAVERGPGRLRAAPMTLRVYEDPARVLRVYRAWADYLARRGLTTQLIDTATGAYEARAPDAVRACLGV